MFVLKYCCAFKGRLHSHLIIYNVFYEYLCWIFVVFGWYETFLSAKITQITAMFYVDSCVCVCVCVCVCMCVLVGEHGKWWGGHSGSRVHSKQQCSSTVPGYALLAVYFHVNWSVSEAVFFLRQWWWSLPCSAAHGGHCWFPFCFQGRLSSPFPQGEADLLHCAVGSVAPLAVHSDPQDNGKVSGSG